MMQLVDGPHDAARHDARPPLRPRRGARALRVDPALVPDVMGLNGRSDRQHSRHRGIGEKTASRARLPLGPVEQILERLDAVETIGLRGAKKVREMLAREARTPASRRRWRRSAATCRSRSTS